MKNVSVLVLSPPRTTDLFTVRFVYLKFCSSKNFCIFLAPFCQKKGATPVGGAGPSRVGTLINNPFGAGSTFAYLYRPV